LKAVASSLKRTITSSGFSVSKTCFAFPS
jgi:hypothetical protein